MMKCLRVSTPVFRRGGVLAVAVIAAGCSELPLAVPAGEHALAKPSSAVVEIWWPTDGARVSGVQPFKARVPGMELSRYNMYWQVDGGQLTYMGDSQVDGPHKEIPVDVSRFTWRGEGPYRINFVAKDLKGKTLAQRSVEIMVGGTTSEPPAPPPLPPGPLGNPFAGARMYVDPLSNAVKQAAEWRSTRPLDAQEMDKVATQPDVTWFGDWHSDIRAAVSSRTQVISGAGALPVYVAYNIPVRDCNSYSSGGATSGAAYRSWIRAFAAGLGTTRAVVVLEPDALAGITCLPTAQQDERYALIADAVAVLKAQGSAVYIDAGHSRWIGASAMAARLQRAGIAQADGFALNVSNYQTTASNITFGTTLSALVGDKRFVIDTSRNGLGPTDDNQWCNPSGRALGAAPTAYTGSPLVDAYLWIKKPGESDGTCNGGPSAGRWWADYALGLAQRAGVIIAYGG